MCKIKKKIKAAINGFKVFRQASRGEYSGNSEYISKLKEDLMRDTSFADDLHNLKKDRRRVAGDMKESFDKLILDNV